MQNRTCTHYYELIKDNFKKINTWQESPYLGLSETVVRRVASKCVSPGT